MLASNQIALKEWAIVTAALAAGRQTMLLRTGGIDEGPEGFRVPHGEFWLLPTRFHQDPAAIVPEAQDLWETAIAQQATPGVFRVGLYAVALEVFRVGELAAAERLAREQVLSLDTVRQRFAYREPGLFAIVLRAYQVPRPLAVADSPYLAGCKSWVELPEALATDGAEPVLDEAAWGERVDRLRRLASS